MPTEIGNKIILGKQPTFCDATGFPAMMSEHVHKFDPNGMSLPRLQHGSAFNRWCCKGNLLEPIIWKQCPDLSSDMSSVWCIKTLVPQRSFGRKTSDCVVGWRLYSQVSRQTQCRICFILPACCVSQSSQRGDKIILPASRKVL